jgi:hypothetical protein
VGAYEVSVRKTGFQEAARPVTLTVGAAFDVPFALVVGQMTTKVQVSADAPVLETARTQMASTISQQEIEYLPLARRRAEVSTRPHVLSPIPFSQFWKFRLQVPAGPPLDVLRQLCR